MLAEPMKHYYLAKYDVTQKKMSGNASLESGTAIVLAVNENEASDSLRKQLEAEYVGDISILITMSRRVGY